jgi:hypothetical protein
MIPSGISVNFYRTTWRNNPDYIHRLNYKIIKL